MTIGEENYFLGENGSWMMGEMKNWGGWKNLGKVWNWTSFRRFGKIERVFWFLVPPTAERKRMEYLRSKSRLTKVYRD